MPNKAEIPVFSNLTFSSEVQELLLSVFPCSHDNLKWYIWWINDQIQRQPRDLFLNLRSHDLKADDNWVESFLTVWQEISRHMVAAPSVTINEIVAHLLECDTFEFDDSPEALINVKNLVFAIIGWQTMLYQADMHSCPSDQLAIHSQMGVHQGQSHMCLKQSSSACKRRMHEFLLGYGLLLPPRNFNALGSPEDKKAFVEYKTVAPASFNAYILSSIGDVTIEWVDSLSCHIEFDPYLNKVFLFRYPSFCLANIPSSETRHSPKSAIYSCAAHRNGNGQWATADDVTQMLQETILSYRLLFGQNKASRQLFRKLTPFENIPEDGRDTFLERLCGQKSCQASSIGLVRDTYDLFRDFPILRSRLVALLRHLSDKKPRTWKELWEDKRDSASWLTFWAVVTIGGLGLILALIQTILQIVQVIQH